MKFEERVALKVSLLARGVQVSPRARNVISRGGSVPLSVHEYATTGGLTIVVDKDLYVNAPFDEGFCEPEALLDAVDGQGALTLSFRGTELPVQLVPLPGYLEARDPKQRPIRHTTFSHADRVRVSPIVGCSMSCKFCDLAGNRYVKRPLEQLLMGIEAAIADRDVPVSHGLISGGTPSPRDYGYWDTVCAGVVSSAPLPFDVMMPPRPTDPEFIDRMVASGVQGFAINLEIFDSTAAARIVPQKHRLGLEAYRETIARAVRLTGGDGRVRSLVLVGLEPEEQTLRAVEFLAQLGCDPVLSPFRPTPATPLANHVAPTANQLERVFWRAREIVERHGVKLGPRCIPCQHNTLSLADGPSYYHSSARLATWRHA